MSRDRCWLERTTSEVTYHFNSMQLRNRKLGWQRQKELADSLYCTLILLKIDEICYFGESEGARSYQRRSLFMRVTDVKKKSRRGVIMTGLCPF